MDLNTAMPLRVENPLEIRRWPSELPLRVVVLIVALVLWVAFAISVLGMIYAVVLGVLFFVTHLAFVAHLRGNAVRLGADQMPDLHRRVTELSSRLGLSTVPAAYVMQAGGMLNAMATKFFGSSLIVLYSELLDACGDNSEARDFIIAHELGHLRAGHLRWRWVLLPGLAVPFLGSAYSRACEYTCDRIGLDASRDAQRALDGLCILAAGARQGPHVNRRALVAQRADLNTVWMNVGQWLATHPPIARRLAVLDPTLDPRPTKDPMPQLAAALLVAVTFILPIVGVVHVVRDVWPRMQAGLAAQQAKEEPQRTAEIASAHIVSLAAAADAYQGEHNGPPPSGEALYAAWSRLHPADTAPLDPYSGQRFGYELRGTEYVIWSRGADAGDSTDDLYYSSHLRDRAAGTTSAHQP